MQTSKKITFWAILVYTFVVLISILAYWTEHTFSNDILGSIEKIVMVIVAAYMGKAGVENYAKIKTNPKSDG